MALLLGVLRALFKLLVMRDLRMTSYIKYKEIITSFTDHNLGVLEIKLNRPEASNAFTIDMIDELCSCLKTADNDPAVRAIIITGEGKNFCAGGDIKSMVNKSEMFSGDPNQLRKNYMYGIQQIPQTMEQIETPVIAAINGAAIGAGLDFCCMCDIRIAAEDAKFGETFVKLGLIPGDGGAFFLQRVVGYSKAIELTLTGDVIDAACGQLAGQVQDKTKRTQRLQLI